MKKRVIIIHGPNINLTGTRERGIYGSETLEQINDELVAHAHRLGLECDVRQSNHEGVLIDTIHQAAGKYDGIILNAGAYTHYSYALRDAISAVSIPCIEVHMSNIHARDEFRSQSVIAPVCAGQIAGLGKISYITALEGLFRIM